MMSVYDQKSFVEPSSPMQEGMIWFHNELMVLLVFVVVFVGGILGVSIYNFFVSRMVSRTLNVHGLIMEGIWTVMPGILLGVVTIPSFALLYSVEDTAYPCVTVKVTGKQWYWTYEYLDVDEEGFCAYDSYMLLEDELNVGELSLLDVDNSLQLPGGVYVRLLITAADVLHSFAVPAFGIKVDAMPGRLNEALLLVERPGTYYGQCSELCGVNHAFMPMGMDVVDLVDYVKWYYRATTDYWVANWSNWDYYTSMR